MFSWIISKTLVAKRFCVVTIVYCANRCAHPLCRLLSFVGLRPLPATVWLYNTVHCHFRHDNSVYNGCRYQNNNLILTLADNTTPICALCPSARTTKWRMTYSILSKLHWCQHYRKSIGWLQPLKLHPLQPPGRKTTPTCSIYPPIFYDICSIKTIRTNCNVRNIALGK